ncbi:hypothetical protein C8R47DRAFT_1230299 [Mycena vitilis]|nr:hypothetical protein C8R47DRAFT_1230299 [Mycena vitilis]
MSDKTKHEAAFALAQHADTRSQIRAEMRETRSITSSLDNLHVFSFGRARVSVDDETGRSSGLCQQVVNRGDMLQRCYDHPFKNAIAAGHFIKRPARRCSSIGNVKITGLVSHIWVDVPRVFAFDRACAEAATQVDTANDVPARAAVPHCIQASPAFLVYKIAGALAELVALGGSLDEVYSVANWVAGRISTSGVGLEPCHLEIGLGIHKRAPLAGAAPCRARPTAARPHSTADAERAFLPFKDDGADEVSPPFQYLHFVLFYSILLQPRPGPPSTTIPTPDLWAASLAAALNKLYTCTRAHPPSRTACRPARSSPNRPLITLAHKSKHTYYWPYKSAAISTMLPLSLCIQFHNILPAMIVLTGIAVLIRIPYPIGSENTIADVLLKMQRMRRISDFKQIQHSVVFPKRGFASLDPTDILEAVGVENLSVLHIRVSVLGGSPTDSSSVLVLRAAGNHLVSTSSTSSSSVPGQRITNSKLMDVLPWRTSGMDNEDWRTSPEHSELKLPPYIQFANLVDNIASSTNDTLGQSTVNQRWARWFCGYDPKEVTLSPGVKPTMGKCIHGLQVLDFLRSQFGAPKRTKHVRKFALPQTTAMVERGVNKLADWQNLIHEALTIVKPPDPQVCLGNTAIVGEPGNTAIVGEPSIPQQTLVISALYSNFASNFKTLSIEKITENFRLAAFQLGWYFQGKFDLPGSLNDHGCAAQVNADRDEITKNWQKAHKNLKPDALAIPLKVALAISPIMLLMPVNLMLGTWNEVQLIRLFECLGSSKPADVEAIEAAIMEEIMLVAQGMKRTEQGVVDAMAKIRVVKLQDDSKDFFMSKSFPPLPMCPVAAITPSIEAVVSPSSNPSGGPEPSNLDPDYGAVFDTYINCHGENDAPLVTVSGSEANTSRSAINNAAPKKKDMRNITGPAPGVATAINAAFGSNDADNESENNYGDTGVDPKLILAPDPTSTSEPPLLAFRDDEPRLPYTNPIQRQEKLPKPLGNPALKLPSTVNKDLLERPPFSYKDFFLSDEDTPPPKPKRKEGAAKKKKKENSAQQEKEEPPRKRKRRVAPAYTSTESDSPAAPKGTTNAALDSNMDVDMVTAPESEDSDIDIQEIPFYDLTGDDDLRLPNIHDLSARPDPKNRDSKGVLIYCYKVPPAPTRTPLVLQWQFRGFHTASKHPRTGELEETKDNDYRVAQEIQSSFLETFSGISAAEPSLPRGVPKYYLDPARNPEYVSGCSKFFVADKETWLGLPPSTRQSIFEHRHIVVKGLAPKLDDNLADAFDLMGIPPSRIVEMHDMSMRTPEEPMKGIITATVEAFLEEAQISDNGRVLNMMDLPFHCANFPDPEGFQHLNTSEAALAQTQSLSGCQYIGSRPLQSHIKWVMATIGSNATGAHIDPSTATMIAVKTGAKMWYCGDSPMDHIHALAKWDPAESCTEGREYEGILLESGDVLFMQPNTLHFVLTIYTSLVWGRNFHAMSTILHSIWAHIHTSILNEALTNASHEDTSVFFIQIQAYWFANFKLLVEGKRPPGPHTRVHLPLIDTWKGFLQMLCLGNLIIFLEALDYRSYLDLRTPSADGLTRVGADDERARRSKVRTQNRLAYQTFADFRAWFKQHFVVAKSDGKAVSIFRHIFERSVIHLAVVLVQLRIPESDEIVSDLTKLIDNPLA